MPYKTLVSNLDQLLHDGLILDFLVGIEFIPAWITRGMNVGDDILAFANPSDHIAMHDLHMVNIEKNLDVGGTNLANNLYKPVEIIALVTGMTFHGM